MARTSMSRSIQTTGAISTTAVSPEVLAAPKIDNEHDGQVKALSFITEPTDPGRKITALWLSSLDGRDGHQLWHISRRDQTQPAKFQIQTFHPHGNFLAAVQGRLVLVDFSTAAVMSGPLSANGVLLGTVDWLITPQGSGTYAITTPGGNFLTYDGTDSESIRLDPPRFPNTGPPSVFSPFSLQAALKGSTTSNATQTWDMSRAGVYISSAFNPLAVLSGSLVGPPPIITKYSPFACNPETIWHVIKWSGFTSALEFNNDPKFLIISEFMVRPLATKFVPKSTPADGKNGAFPQRNDCILPMNFDLMPFPARIVADGGFLQIELLREDAFLAPPGPPSTTNFEQSTFLVRRRNITDPKLRGWQFLSVASTDWPGMMGLPRQVLFPMPVDDVEPNVFQVDDATPAFVSPLRLDSANQRWRQINLGLTSLYANESNGFIWQLDSSGPEKVVGTRSAADIPIEWSTYRLQVVGSINGVNMSDSNQEWTFREWQFGA